MIISIDYDGTYTADERTWCFVIGAFEAMGHEVICTTNRALPDERLDKAMTDLEIPVVYAGVRHKRDAVREDLGLEVDIWIDDMPATVDPPTTLP